ncbi:hypothetical protein EDD11_008739 [Mortierella claussenii]|nr:hypothetical protein EDD11_008739 [Mortierella claussenii]
MDFGTDGPALATRPKLRRRGDVDFTPRIKDPVAAPAAALLSPGNDDNAGVVEVGVFRPNNEDDTNGEGRGDGAALETAGVVGTIPATEDDRLPKTDFGVDAVNKARKEDLPPLVRGFEESSRRGVDGNGG